MTTLYKHQQKIVDEFPRRHLLAHDCGTGKTITSLSLAKKAGVSTLIICPKMLKEKWVRESKEWLSAPHMVLTKEEFKRDFRKIGKYDAIIVDECHNTFASLKSQGYKSLLVYIKVHTPTYVWLLTATPFTSSPMSVYALGRLLNAPWKWVEFRDLYFRERHIGRRVIFEPKPGIEDQIAARVKEIGSVIRLDECVDVPEQTFEEEVFEYTKEQLKAIEDMKARESNPLTRFGKAHEISAGILIGNEYQSDRAFPCLKNDRVVELAKENNKVVVFARYNKHLELLSDMLNKEGVLNVIINGDTKDRDNVIAAANAAKRVVLLIQADCAEGYEIPTFSLVVHVSHTYSFVKYYQSTRRVLRINAPKPNYYLSLITKDSADEPVMEAIRRKESFHDAIFIKNNPSLI
jgi:superfamily II DNA or RNA helicase